MNRRGGLAIAAVIGFLAGAMVVSAVRSDTSRGGDHTPTTDPSPAEPSAADPASTSTALPSTAAPATSVPPLDDVLLIWTSGGLAPGLAAEVAGFTQTERVSVVRAAELPLVSVRDADGAVTEAYVDGWHVPIDVLAVDPLEHAQFTTSALDALGPGRALMSATGAELRSADVGTVLEFSSGTVEVVGVIDDASASGAELIVDVATGEHVGIVDERFLLVAHDGDRPGLQDATVAALGGSGAAAPIRFRSPAETTWMRHGDAVLPLAQVKLRFGEFAIRDREGRDVEIDPRWIAENIVEVEVPILGSVRCHRLIIDQLESALRELADRAITQVIDADEFGGCYTPRRIAAGLPLSRHSWGIALDLNIGDNPRGSFPTQDPRLVDAMRTAGFGWGGSWLVPDPAHYEIIEAPVAA